MTDTLLPQPKLTHCFTLRCAVDTPLEIGHGPYGRRRCIPILSGTVRGKYLNGEVVPGGADFLLMEEDNTAHINTNYVVKSEDGAHLYFRTEGTRSGPPQVLKALVEGGDVDPGQFWFHLHVKIETGSEEYRWLNRRVIVARARREKGEVAYDAYFLENDDP